MKFENYNQIYIFKSFTKNCPDWIKFRGTPVHLYGRNFGFYAKFPTNLSTIRQYLRISIEIMVLNHVPKMAHVRISSELRLVHLCGPL